MERDLVIKSFKGSLSAKEGFFTDKNIDLLIETASLIAECFNSGGKLLIAGNGGSAGDAQHLAAEFVNRFVIERPPLPAIALTTDTSILTSIGNDYAFDQVFSKQIKALGKEGDLFLAISTSGNSANIVKAARAAGALSITTIALTGNNGGELAAAAERCINVDESVTARIQEVHITICHILCELVDHILFECGGKEGA
jgi:D-sedoheptulose 7-phosphate isomerase